MKKFLFLLSMLVIGGTAVAQVSRDSLKRSIQKVNVQKAVNEDHARVIAELKALTSQYESSLDDVSNCTEAKQQLQYELNLYQLLEMVELKTFEKIYALELAKSGVVVLDTMGNRGLRYISITFEAINNSFDGEKLELRSTTEKNIATNNAWLQRLYPYTSSLISNGTIIVNIKPKIFVEYSQVQRIIFPPLIVQGSTVIKSKYAAEYLNCIRTICKDPRMTDYNFEEYKLLEKQEVPNQNLDKLLALRVAFIKILKDDYDKKNP